MKSKARGVRDPLWAGATLMQVTGRGMMTKACRSLMATQPGCLGVGQLVAGPGGQGSPGRSVQGGCDLAESPAERDQLRAPMLVQL